MDRCLFLSKSHVLSASLARDNDFTSRFYDRFVETRLSIGMRIILQGLATSMIDVPIADDEYVRLHDNNDDDNTWRSFRWLDVSLLYFTQVSVDTRQCLIDSFVTTVNMV